MCKENNRSELSDHCKTATYTICMCE